MLRAKKITRFEPGNGKVHPGNASHISPNIGDVFGPRPFFSHIATVGYDYDFHRGIDYPGNKGDPVYAPLGGHIIRRHYTHFRWTREESLDELDEDDPNNLFTYSVDEVNRQLDLAWTTVPTVASTNFLDSSKLILRQLVDPTTEDCDTQMRLSAVVNTGSGGDLAIGVAMWDEINGEYAAIDFDGDTITCHAVDSGGAGSADGTTTSNSTATWLRVIYDASETSTRFEWSTDGDTWNTVATWSSPSFTTAGLTTHWRSMIYLRKTTTGSVDNSGVISVEFFANVDGDNIDRFGNWVEVSNGSEKFMLMHMSHIYAQIGDKLIAGSLVGEMGTSGFDDKSGRILYDHVHVEYIPDGKYSYFNAEVRNPLNVGVLPRDNVDNNVTVVRDTQDDPNSDTSWHLEITIARGDQDFDATEFSLTGNLATRTINFNTRAGINANVDIPDEDGVYIVANDFDNTSTEYVLDIYFQKSVVGTTFVSAYVADNLGTVLWSE